jgi:magnesium transporter
LRFKINKYLIDDIENEDHPSNFDYTEDYSILVLRLPYIDGDEVSVISYVFYIDSDNGKVYRYLREKKDFEELGSFDALYQFLDVRVDKILSKISKLQFSIEKLEDSLYENEEDQDFPKKWLLYKKDLSLIERLMGHALVAFERFIKHYKSKLDYLEYNDLYEHMDRAHRLSKSAIEKIDNLYSFYKVKTDEKMNNIMFMLTIISAVFMPLTLVTGFFGMNTGGLPYTDDPNGTLKVTIAVFLFEIPFVAFIWYMMRRD